MAKLTTLKRRAKAAELRAAGMTYEAIAAALKDEGLANEGYNRSMARLDSERAVKEIVRTTTDTLIVKRAEVEDGYREVITAFRDTMLMGDAKAATIFLKAYDSIARLHGLDSAQKFDINMNADIHATQSINIHSDLDDADLAKQIDARLKTLSAMQNIGADYDFITAQLNTPD